MKANISKIFICLSLVTAILISASIPVYADEALISDKFLLSLGVPRNVIEQLPEKQKELICSTVDPNAVFKSYEKEAIIDEDQQNASIQSTIAGIPESEMTLSILAFEEVRDTGTYYAIYPSFIWPGLSRLKNDSFAMAMYPNWEVVPQKNNLEVWNRNSSGELMHHTSVPVLSSSSSGYVYKIPNTIGSLQGFYEGHAYLHAIKTNSNATHAISLTYVDDVSSLLNASYGISLGAFSISVSGDTSKIRVRSGNYYF